MHEKVEEYPLGSKLHLNAVLVWICGLRLWQNVDLEGSHIHIFHRPRPPKRAGRASSSRSRSDGAARPVSEGINLVLSNSSSGCKRWSMLGIVLAT